MTEVERLEVELADLPREPDLSKFEHLKELSSVAETVEDKQRLLQEAYQAASAAKSRLALQRENLESALRAAKRS